MANTFGDYRDQYPVGTRVVYKLGSGKTRNGTVVAPPIATATEHAEYLKDKTRVWAAWDGASVGWMSAKFVTKISATGYSPSAVLKPSAPAAPRAASSIAQPKPSMRRELPPEPKCSCDIKALFSYGCTCGYAKWNQLRMKA